MKVAKIKINFLTLVWLVSPFSRATIKCDFTVLLLGFIGYMHYSLKGDYYNITLLKLNRACVNA